MKVKFVYKGNRNQLICVRSDESVEMADLGPSLPYHDLAHFVVEKHLHLQHGFFGNIHRGMTVQALSDKEIIKTLPVESIVAEIATRALQSIWSGAVPVDQYSEVLKAEFEALGISERFIISTDDVTNMQLQYDDLISQWTELKEGEALELEFDFQGNI